MNQKIYQIFSIIYLKTTNGYKFLMNNVILTYWKKFLCKIITHFPRRIKLVLGTEVNNADDIMPHFNLAVINGEEPIVIKKLNSIYQLD